MVARFNKSDGLQQVPEKDQHAPVELVDADGTAAHAVLPIDGVRQLFDDDSRREIQRGIDQTERGESEPWDMEPTLTKSHRPHAEYTKQS